VPGLAGQDRRADAELAEAEQPFVLEVGAEDELRVGGNVQPAVGDEFLLELPRAPAGIAQREDARTGPFPSAMARRMSVVAVRAKPESTGIVPSRR